MSHSVDGIGAAFGEDDIGSFFGIQEGAHFLTSLLESICSSLTHLMHTAVYIAVRMAIVILDSLNDLKRFLATRCIVEIDQSLAVHFFFQDGEKLPYFLEFVYCHT